MMNIETASRDELLAVVPSVLWYHSIDLGGGVVTPGVFDIRPYLDGYGFPADMKGLKVLDIGPASGFFSFEFERRGAQVTTLDLPAPFEKDFVGGDIAMASIRAKNAGHNDLDETLPGMRMDFPIAHKLLNSKVRNLYAKIYDVKRAVGDEQFDIVFLGSILNHLANPMAALSAVRSVCKGKVIVANPFEPDADQTQPIARFIGRQGRKLSSWWVPTISCMEEMLHAAGFGSIKVVSPHLKLVEQNGNPVPHFVIHADAETNVERWQAFTDAAPIWTLRPKQKPAPVPTPPVKKPPLTLAARIRRKLNV